MPLQIVKGDITKMKVDAVVNAANTSLLGGGGVDGCIHRAAGRELLAECRTLGGCKTGDAKITKGYNLPCKYVIHTPGPIWHGGAYGERELLISCYNRSLALAEEHSCKTVAFPLISAGEYGYPKDKALETAVNTISGFLAAYDMTVYIVIKVPKGTVAKVYQDIFTKERSAYAIPNDAISSTGDEPVPGKYVQDVLQNNASDRGAAAYPNDATPSTGDGPVPGKYVQDVQTYSTSNNNIPETGENSQQNVDISEQKGTKRTYYDKNEFQINKRLFSDILRYIDEHYSCANERLYESACLRQEADEESSLKKALSKMDESFSQMLLRKIDEKGITDAECYKRANIDRKLFSKIRKNADYRPSKPTAVAFAVALELSPEETEELLRKAGYALSHSSRFDIIVEYFILNGKYNIFEINEALFAFDQSLLGAQR